MNFVTARSLRGRAASPTPGISRSATPAVGRTATTLLVARRAGAHLRHRHADDGGRARAGGGATSAISTFVWLLALAYLYTEMTTDERAMGVFILPLLVALQAIPAFSPGVEDRAAVLQGPLFGMHVSSLLFAYASFALACVIGITYVLLFKEIKAKHLGFFYARLPSLQVLDRMNQRAIVIGWIFLTDRHDRRRDLGGAGARRLGAAIRASRRCRCRIRRFSSRCVCWCVYSFELFAARRIGWGGRRAAYLSALGFAIVLLNFVPISYFLTKSHNF